MKLLSLKIRNFRSFGEKAVEIAFSDGLNLMVGENNVGKSTILRSLNILKGGYSFTSNDYYKGETNRKLLIEANIKLSLTEAQNLTNMFVSPYGRNMKKVGKVLNFFLRNKISFAYTSGRGIYLRFGKLHISGNRGSMVSHLDAPGTYRVLEWKDSMLGRYFNPDNHLPLFEIVRNELTKGKKMSVNFNFNPCAMFSDFLKQKAKSFSEIRQSPMGTSDHILESYDGRQVADVLFTLKNGKPIQREKFEQVKKKFSGLFPNLKLEVQKESRDSPPRIVIEKTSIGFEVPIEFVGAGIGEIIIFLTHLIASTDMMFGLDMPELHFHPHAQRLLRNIIREHSENNQFLVVTHSPTFIESRQIENTIVVREMDGQTTVTQIDQNHFGENELLRLFRQLDAGNKEFFFSRGVLAVEGPTETGAMPIFSKALNRDFDELGVSLVVSGKFFGLFLKLLREFSFPYLVMCDKDALMNIEKSARIGEQKAKTSPALYSLWISNSLTKKEKRKIIDMESKIQIIRPKPRKEIYPDSLFEELRKIASKHGVYILPSDFEGVLERDGYSNILRQAKRSSRSKVIRGRYAAEQIVEKGESIPKEFCEIIQAITEKSIRKS